MPVGYGAYKIFLQGLMEMGGKSKENSGRKAHIVLSGAANHLYGEFGGAPWQVVPGARA